VCCQYLTAFVKRSCVDSGKRFRCREWRSSRVTLCKPLVAFQYRLTDAPRNMENMSKFHQYVHGEMPVIRNILASFGAFWLSLRTVAPLVWLFGKLNDRIIYDDSVLEAVAMGAMTSMGRSVAAIIAGLLVTFTASGRKPERWAFVVATLYVIDAPVRHHWHLGPTAWDRIWQTSDLLFPAFACVAAAAATRLRRETVDAPAFLWLGLTCFYYRHATSKSAAWLFALFPIAFAETMMHAFVWFLSTHPPN
jgi:hypothetical protein